MLRWHYQNSVNVRRPEFNLTHRTWRRDGHGPLGPWLAGHVLAGIVAAAKPERTQTTHPNRRIASQTMAATATTAQMDASTRSASETPIHLASAPKAGPLSRGDRVRPNNSIWQVGGPHQVLNKTLERRRSKHLASPGAPAARLSRRARRRCPPANRP